MQMGSFVDSEHPQIRIETIDIIRIETIDIFYGGIIEDEVCGIILLPLHISWYHVLYFYLTKRSASTTHKLVLCFFIFI